MATITFNYDLNVSLQRGDELFVSKLENGQGGSNHPLATSNTKPKKLGNVTLVDHATNTVEHDGTNAGLTSNHFIMFNKNRLVN